jgi:hypothetical protein
MSRLANVLAMLQKQLLNALKETGDAFLDSLVLDVKVSK